METFTINQLVTVIEALRLYQEHLEKQLEDMSADEDNYPVTADEMVYVRELLPKIERMHEELYQQKFGESAKHS